MGFAAAASGVVHSASRVYKPYHFIAAHGVCFRRVGRNPFNADLRLPSVVLDRY
jgi:hypothetical protein